MKAGSSRGSFMRVFTVNNKIAYGSWKMNGAQSGADIIFALSAIPFW
jgi:hypothetical protein